MVRTPDWHCASRKKSAWSDHHQKPLFMVLSSQTATSTEVESWLLSPFTRACSQPLLAFRADVATNTSFHKSFIPIFFVSPGHHRTIQNLIPGWTTIVNLLKQVKNWQCPSRDPWSNCLINSREDDKGQSYNHSGRQKDNSKTICGPLGNTQVLF